MRHFKTRTWFLSGTIAVIYVLFVIWLENYWLLFGLLIIGDIFFTRLIPWTWIFEIKIPRYIRIIKDAVILIIIALLITQGIRILFFEAYKIPTPSMEKTLLVGDFIFVSKIHYGPKLPITPLSLPLVPAMLSTGKVTYLKSVSLPYKRLKGISSIQRNDVIVFHFPEGDTVVVRYPGQNYHALVAQYGREYIINHFKIIAAPVDKRDNYVKRCVGLPGDTVQIKDNKVFVNRTLLDEIGTQQFRYYVRTADGYLHDSVLNKMRIHKNDFTYNPNTSLYLILMSIYQKNCLNKVPGIENIQLYSESPLHYNNKLFPHTDNLWTIDNYGPVWVPKKGKTVYLNPLNYPYYKRIIETFEKNMVSFRGDSIFINGKLANSYTFRMNYFFVLGDNRHNSADSRFWGYVPEDHIVGKAVAIWFSKDPMKGLEGIRKERMFKSIN